MGGMAVEQVYTLSEAAKVASVSLPTVRRRKQVLEGAGAVVSPSGWEIPHSALVKAFPHIADEKPQDLATEPPEIPDHQSPADELRDAKDRIRRLEGENMVLRAHVERWETVARERLDALNDQRLAFRALAMTRHQEIEAPKPGPHQPAEEPRRGWWSRTFG